MRNAEELRRKIWLAMDILKREKLYLHSKKIPIDTPNGAYEFPVVVGFSVLNAIVGNGSMLLYGGYGYGKTTLLKYLGRILTGASIEEIEASMLRSNPQLTEEKIVARLHLGKLIGSGEEVVIWRKFVKSFWKIVDEINRLSPAAQDAILSLLGEGIAKYFDETYHIPRYVLYATINPRDVGTFPLGMPLLDRFGIAVIVEAPALEDIEEIMDAPDDKLVRRIIPNVMTVEELVDVWGYVWMTPLSDDARLFISTLVKELSICDRVNKETGIFLTMGSKICSGCHFEPLDTVCKIVYTPLSVRAQRDLVRYSKALAWLLGLNEVPLSVVVSIAPYVLWHRLRFADKYLERKFYDRFKLAREIVNIVLRNYLQRAPLMSAYYDLRRGIVDTNMIISIKNTANSDLIIKHEVIPKIDMLLEDKYIMFASRLMSAIRDRDEDRARAILNKAREELSKDQYGILRTMYCSELRKYGRTVCVPLSVWRSKREEIGEILQEPKVWEVGEIKGSPKVLRIDRGIEFVEIYMFGVSDNSPVFITIYSLTNKLYKRIAMTLGIDVDNTYKEKA